MTVDVNPFRPGHSIDPKFFGGRHEQVDSFTESLEYAIAGNPVNIAVLGEHGIGKTSLLRKCEEKAREKKCIAVRRDLDSSVKTLAELSHFMLKALKTDGSSNLPKSIRAANGVSNFFNKYTINLSAFGFAAGIGGVQVPSSGIQDELYGELLKIWQSVKKNVAAIVIMLDESKQLQGVDGAWSFLRSVFTRLQENEAKYMLLISGKPDFVTEAKDLFSPIERFLTRMDVESMTIEETQEALERPLHYYERSIDHEAVKEIHSTSNGHPYVIQTFGYCLFQEGTKHIENASVTKAMPKIMTRLSNQLFKNRFDATTPDEREVLLSLSEIGGVVSPKDIERKYPWLEKKNVSKLLGRLAGKDCIKKFERAEYSIFLPLFAEYVKARMEKPVKQS